MNSVVRVSKENSKQVKSAGGNVLNFVNKHWALRKGYLQVLDFKVIHPLDSEFVLIKLEIKRY